MNSQQTNIVVVGAGISGTKAAIDMAQQGFSVTLVDRSAFNGGILSRLDHQFPNNHCGMCRILPMIDRRVDQEFCLRKGLFNENIRFLRSSEVNDVAGQPGQLEVTITTRPTGVDPDKCSGCGECEKVCPVTVDDPFNSNLSVKKAISLPVPHMTGNSRVIDWEVCTRCNVCVDACPDQAITLNDKPIKNRLDHVGAVVVASGVDLFDPTGIDFYGYGTLKNVVTATDFERILSSSGPYQGNNRDAPPRPSDGKAIKKIGWIQCVGSRNLSIDADFCSNVCCMFALKEAILAQDKIENAETTIFYMDMRTFGRDYQRYRDQAENEKGVRFVRCRVHSVYPHEATEDLTVSYVDHTGQLSEEVFDLVVLSTGRKAKHPHYEWAAREGVFRMEGLPGFKDIADSITGAMSLTGRVMRSLKGLVPGSDLSEDTKQPEMGLPPALNAAEKSTRALSGQALQMKAKRLPLTKTRHVTKKALVIGGGPSGLTVSSLLASNGIEVILVEKADRLGGNLPEIAEDDFKAQVDKTLAEVQNNPLITVLTRSEAISKKGVAGAFSFLIKNLNSGTTETIACGAVILATGGRKAETNAYGLGENERVISGFELSKRLNAKDSPVINNPPRSVAMIQCGGSREEPNNYCSRICCLQSLKNAIQLKTLAPETDIYIFYRDMMTYGESEKVYTRARRLGVIFIPFTLDQRPLVEFEGDMPLVSAIDPLTQDRLKLKVDLVAVATGLVPNSTANLQSVFEFETTRDHFIQEADTKWRPVDTGREGIFVCGLAKGPLRLSETLLEAEAVVQRTLGLLNKEIIKASPVSAFVRQAICSLCERCIAVCPYGARYYDDGRIVVDPAACQGCGACASECPNNATLICGYEDDGIMNALEAIL